MEGFSSALLSNKNMQTIKEFLDKHIDGYLICDIQRMSEIKAFENGYGACGYPMLMSILSGVELIGILNYSTEISAKLFRSNSRTFFENGWTVLFSKNAKYSGESTCKIFRDLIRNGLAHMYLSKPNIGITKSHPEAHLQFEGNMFFVHPNELFNDFIKAYEKIKPDILKSQKCQSRLNEVLYLMTLESVELLSGKSLGLTESVYPTTGTPLSATSAMSIESSKAFKKLFEK